MIVVNDSGEPLPSAEWHADCRVKVITTQRRERSAARNTGAAIAQGRYLHFLDDDDLLLPGALNAWYRLAHATQADGLYGAYQCMNEGGEVFAEFAPDIQGNIFPVLVAGESLATQSCLLEARLFFEVGAFDTTFGMAEDRDLMRRFAFAGRFARTAHRVVRIRVGEGTSSTRGRWALRPEYDRRGREKALATQGALARVRAAAPSSYWRGRVSRAYFASMVWNLQQQRVTTAISRGVTGAALLTSQVTRSEFWRGLRTPVKQGQAPLRIHQ